MIMEWTGWFEYACRIGMFGMMVLIYLVVGDIRNKLNEPTPEERAARREWLENYGSGEKR
jgi:hypothetical protein